MVCCERVVRVSQWECGSGVGEKEDEKLDDSGVLVSKQEQPRSAAESTFESVTWSERPKKQLIEISAELSKINA